MSVEQSLAERRRTNLRRLFEAESIAFVGGRSVVRALERCRRSGFAGKLWLVNPHDSEIDGIACHRSITDLPSPPEATFVGVPRELTIDVVAQIARAGGAVAVCYAAGFSEIGAEGSALQERLASVAGDVAVLGPNCNGVVNNVTGGHLWPTPGAGRRVASGAALIAQSGGLSVHLLMNQRSVDFAYALSVGNQAMLGVEDCVEVLADHPLVSVIAVYLEGVRDVPAFSRAAERALRCNKPVVILKAGTSQVGAGVTVSHTSSISGSRELYDALFDRLGIVGVSSCTELLETVKAFSVSRPPQGRRIVVFTCSGGSSALGADRCEELGLELPTLSPAQAGALKAQLPYFAAVSNPLDYNTSLWGKEDELRGVFKTALAEGYDAGVLLIDYTPEEFGDAHAEAAVSRALVHARHETGVPAFVVSLLPELLPPEARRTLIDGGVAPLQGLGDGMKAIAAITSWAAKRQDLMAGDRPLALDPLPDLQAGAPVRLLDEWQSKNLLASFGLPVPEGKPCSSADAARVATGIGFPVVVKVVSDALAHKTEAGALRLGLQDAAAVDAAVAEMQRSVRVGPEGRPPAVFLVEPMIRDCLAELIVGVVRHPGFGLALVIGAGGTLVELLRDSATLLLPTDRAAIERALGTLAVAKLLGGFRGRGEADMPALVEAIEAIANFAHARRDHLVELDVNPLMVRPRGRGVVAVDAVVRLSFPSN